VCLHMLAESVVTSAHREWAQRLTRWLPAFAMAGSRGVAVALQFAVQVVVGALAGPAGLGLLQLFNSWTCILGEVLALGLPARSMRVIAVDWQRRDGHQGGALLRAAALLIMRASAIAWGVAALVLATLWWAGVAPSADIGPVLLAVLLAAPLFALLRLGAEALKAVDSPLQAIALESLAAPLVIIVVCTACWTLGRPVTPTILLLAGLAGFAVALLAVWRSIQMRLDPARATGTAGLGDRADLTALWTNSMLTILFMHLPFVILPWFATPDEIGVFAVAHKLVSVITTLLILLAAVFGPAFARAADTRDSVALARLLLRTQQLSLLVFMPLVLALLLGSEPLGALFNLPDHALQPFLLALAAGQLVNAATGLPGVLLNMAGAAGRELRTLLLALCIGALLAPWAGATHGAIGIAWAFSIALVIKNLASYLAAQRYLSHLENGR
jgi:O-antigen/teichoic acid export membrane protein